MNLNKKQRDIDDNINVHYYISSRTLQKWKLKAVEWRIKQHLDNIKTVKQNIQR